MIKISVYYLNSHDENITHGDWKNSRIDPLPKKVYFYYPNNWRGIDLPGE